MNHHCQCVSAGQCPLFRRTMNSREHHICRGYDRDGNTAIAPERRAIHIRHWAQQAAESMGLGDQIKSLTDAAGISQCGSCVTRQRTLNAAVPATHWMTRLLRRLIGRWLPTVRQPSLTLPGFDFNRWSIDTATVTPAGLAECDLSGDSFPFNVQSPETMPPTLTVSKLPHVPFEAGPDVCPVVTAENDSVPALRDIWKGGTVFLCCGGPSLSQMDLTLLERRGIIVAAVNQVAATHVRPHVAITVDKSAHFHSSIWNDPAILKLARYETRNDRIAERDGDAWKATGPSARDFPGTLFYQTSNKFDAASFLTAGSVVWGGEAQLNGKTRETRNVMLAALRLLYWMGARRVVLIGCDFHMQAGQSYAFAESKNHHAAGFNNNTYSILDGWFRELRPHFEASGYHVLNATPGSHLTAFDRINYQQAVESAAAGITPATPTSVAGLYKL